MHSVIMRRRVFTIAGKLMRSSSSVAFPRGVNIEGPQGTCPDNNRKMLFSDETVILSEKQILLRKLNSHKKIICLCGKPYPFIGKLICVFYVNELINLT